MPEWSLTDVYARMVKIYWPDKGERLRVARPLLSIRSNGGSTNFSSGVSFSLPLTGEVVGAVTRVHTKQGKPKK